MAYTVYTLNSCPHHSTNLIIPEERWTKHPPKLDDLKVFRCVGYVHQSQGKLKPRAVKRMILGFTKELKASSFGIL